MPVEFLIDAARRGLARSGVTIPRATFEACHLTASRFLLLAFTLLAAETMDEWFCDRETLKYDEACINLRTDHEDSNVWLYLLSTDCALVSHTRIRFLHLRFVTCFAYLYFSIRRVT